MHPKHGETEGRARRQRCTNTDRGAPAPSSPPAPAEPGSAPAPSAISAEQRPRHPGQPRPQRPGWAQPSHPHLHGLRRLPDQATCLCLLQGLRASHPQRALGSGLGDSKAGFTAIPPASSPGSSGAGEAAVLQCRWKQLLASVAAALRQLLFSELLPVLVVGWFVLGFFFSVQMNGVYKIERNPGRCDRVIIS